MMLEKEEQTLIRARITEIIGDYAVLEFDGITKIVSLNILPKQARTGDIVVYRNGKLILDVPRYGTG
jgi:hydrogenase maturation factor